MKFENLKNTLQESIFTWDYFTDFKKVKGYVQKIEVELNILNYLIGKQNIEEEFINLIREYPKVRKALPLLIAVRKNKLKDTPIISEIDTSIPESKQYIFFEKLNEHIEKELLIFFRESGLKDIFENKYIKNLVDYTFGVEVGFDTNARKNRTGKIMEKFCNKYLSAFCQKNNFKFLVEATKIDIENTFGIIVNTNSNTIDIKNDRRFDFVIFNDKINKLYIFEVNYYSSHGSKPNSIAREYKDLFDLLKKQDIEFIWITDGKGWLKMLSALEQTVNHNNYVINLDMLKNGILEKICNS